VSWKVGFPDWLIAKNRPPVRADKVFGPAPNQSTTFPRAISAGRHPAQRPEFCKMPSKEMLLCAKT